MVADPGVLDGSGSNFEKDIIWIREKHTDFKSLQNQSSVSKSIHLS